MKAHLLRVDRPVVEFAPLIAAVRQDGGRVGWLELADLAAPSPEPLPSSLTAAATAGVLRAVAVGGGQSVAVKPMRGEPVLRDVLREHFRGCRLVLVHGDPSTHGVDASQLAPDGESDDWFLSASGDPQPRRLDTGSLVAALRRPDPWFADTSIVTLGKPSDV